LRQEGRVYFMINCAIKSISVYSTGLNLAFPHLSMTSPQVLTGISFLSLGASLYGSYIFTKNMEIGYGRVEFMNYGGDLGIIYPTLFYMLLQNTGEFKYTNELYGWSQMLLFPAGIFAGSKVKFAGNFEYGNASVMTSLSKFGIMYGFALPWIFSPPNENNRNYLTYSTSLSMIFIPTGFYVGKILVDKYGPFSSGRSVFITTCGVMGSLSGLVIPTLWDEKQQEVYPITLMLGHISGTLFGFNYMKKRSYTFGQGMFMIASAVVGTAVAEAFPLIAKVENTHKPYVIFGLLGSWGGLVGGEALARSLFEKSSRDNSMADRYSVKLAGIYQLPLLWAYSKSKSFKENKNIEIRVPVVEVSF
ncbi:MAG: hypothetical protein N2053_07555, partial [Chitinispirillaceae bacterium]|nr:hypothetical protein [Chitinispirillaceae bacterium]